MGNSPPPPSWGPRIFCTQCKNVFVPAGQKESLDRNTKNGNGYPMQISGLGTYELKKKNLFLVKVSENTRVGNRSTFIIQIRNFK